MYSVWGAEIVLGFASFTEISVFSSVFFSCSSFPHVPIMLAALPLCHIPLPTGSSGLNVVFLLFSVNLCNYSIQFLAMEPALLKKIIDRILKMMVNT